ncbi:hypothetical protein KO481_40180 [Nocardia sp. NEAU-G5]|uniref:WXG100 family type VII secretion target n=1 Tax=Nocardia albiluteola TaxID=2842303 RepID=A0ABS6BD80_9NOCA|nr:hypothetical protein [Nocardia albiluteola]MBU3067725.1 hypothetical protein [Nocardia albiluteola]
MADKMMVEVNKLRTAADKTERVHDRIYDVLTTLQASMVARGPVWGNDSLGQQFYGDDKQGYKGSSENLITGAGQIADTMDSFSQAQYKSADQWETADQQSAGQF